MSFYKKYKPFLFSGLISGLVYALMMVGFDYFKDEPFSLVKFAANALFLGFFSSFIFYRKHKKQNENS